MGPSPLRSHVLLACGLVTVSLASQAQSVWIAEPGVGAHTLAARALGAVDGALALAVPEIGRRLVLVTPEGSLREWTEDGGWRTLPSAWNVSRISAGTGHTLGATTDGRLLAWGEGGDGQLGDGQLRTLAEPRAVEGLPRVRSVAAGWNYSLALDEEGGVWAWGGNWQGIAPQHAERLVTRPVRLGGLPAIRAILVRGNRPFGLDEQDRVWTWGRFPVVRRDASPRIVTPDAEDLLPGVVASLAGELRDPQALAALVGSHWWPSLEQPNRLLHAAGGDAVTIDPAGNGVSQNRDAPGWSRRIAAAAGWCLAWVAVDEGAAETGSESKEPALSARANASEAAASRPPAGGAPEALAVGTSLAAGARHSLMVHADGSAWGWGDSRFGQSGPDYRHLPNPIPGLASVHLLAGGDRHSLALLADGTVWAWGAGDRGQAGPASRPDQLALPVEVTPLSGVKSVAAGGFHSLAARNDGTVWSWGWNSWGQLGADGPVTRWAPQQVSGFTGVTAVAAGGLHSLALKADGTVWAWGNNANGQLGDGSTAARSSPAQVTGLASVIAIAAGEMHSLALKSDGTVWAWGRNTNGQLGDGVNTDRASPVRAGALTGVVAVAGGGEHSMALRNDGTVWTWGANTSFQLGEGTQISRNVPAPLTALPGVAAIAAGAEHSLALGQDGAVWAWGSKGDGQLGIDDANPGSKPAQSVFLSFREASALVGAGAGWGSVFLEARPPNAQWSLFAEFLRLIPSFGTGSQTVIYEYDPNPTTDARTFTVCLPGQTFTVTQAGVRLTPASLAVPAAGVAGRLIEVAVKPGAFGWSASASVGWITITQGATGTGDGSVRLDVAANPAETPRTGLLVVGGQTLAITQDGTRTVAPVPVGVRAGFSGVAVLQSDGTVVTWGAFWESARRAAPVPDLTEVENLAAGNHILAVRRDGTVWGWGSNAWRQVGLDSTPFVGTPTRVPGIDQLAAVAASTGHSLALRRDGTVWAWGWNEWGQLGDGTQSRSRGTPLPVGGLSSIAAVTAGGSRSFAVGSNGNVWAWGYNADGALGDGTRVGRLSPTPLSGVAGVKSIAAGADHTLALLHDGTVRSWGENLSGQLGDGGIQPRTTPGPVPGLAGITAIAAGEYFSLALKNDGTVWAWGRNDFGQLGDGTTNRRTVPTRIPSLSGVGAIAAGAHFSVALRADGTLWTWGSNLGLALGESLAGDFRSIPGQVIVPWVQLSPSSVLVGPREGSGQVTLTVSPQTAVWTAGPGSAWFWFGSPSSGNGSATIGYQYLANPDSTSRTATAPVGGWPFTIRQAGIALTPSFETIPYPGTAGRQVIVSVDPNEFAWSATSPSDWISLTNASGVGSGALTFRAAGNPTTQARMGYIDVEGQRFTVNQAAGNLHLSRDRGVIPAAGESGWGLFASSASSTYRWTAVASEPWMTITSGAEYVGHGLVRIDFAPNPSRTARTGSLTVDSVAVPITQLGEGTSGPLRFVAVTPCRVADTRAGEGKTGPFGPPSLEAQQTRTLPIPQGGCGIPPEAKAYSLNFTVVPRGPMAYLTAWPQGLPQPLVSTLNAFEGQIVANAAIVPAGAQGASNVFAAGATELIVDINGYFVQSPF